MNGSTEGCGEIWGENKAPNVMIIDNYVEYVVITSRFEMLASNIIT